MLPTLGSFKDIQCPVLSHCKRPTCVFSHEQQPQLKSSVTSTSRSTKQQQSTSSSSKRPLPSRNINDKAKVTKLGNSGATKIIQTKISTETTGTSHIKNPHHRVAHTPSFTGPPTIKPDISSHTALKIRQNITNKLYEQYTRIYPSSIHKDDPQLAAKRTQEHERQILDTTTNTAGYKQQSMSALMSLKKQAVVTEPFTVCKVPPMSSPSFSPPLPSSTPTLSTKPTVPALQLRGKQENTTHWRSTCPLFVDQHYINSLVLSVEQLDFLQYPTTALLDDNNRAIEKSKRLAQQKVCERCHSLYSVRSILDEKESIICVYHPGRPRTTKSYGENVRVYSCCSDPIGATGCEMGPHVFKDDDMRNLHASIPFVTVPKSSSSNEKEKLLALDCEMGYTTLGMELIRLTVVNANYEKVIDELVLPSQMVIDLNTRYSGVDTLVGAKHNLVSIRQALFDKMNQDTILVGHGLENDLQALRIIHDKVIDTSQVYPHPKGHNFRYGLRALANMHLSKFIQEGSDGHDSLEDAATCLELLYYHHEKSLK